MTFGPASVLGLLVLAVSSCRGPAPAPEQAAQRPRGASGPRRISLPADVIAAARIRTASPSRMRLDAIVEVPGETAADPDRIASVAPPVAGRIESIVARLGVRVHQGDVLYTVRVPDLSKLRADVLTRRAMMGAAQKNAERVASLYEEHAASQREAQQAAAEASAMEAQARSAGEILSVLGASRGAGVENSLLTLRAPISGTIIARNAIVGQPVTAEQTIATVADLGEVWFLVRVYEKDLARVGVGQPAEVVLSAYPAQHFTGTLTYVSEQLDPATRAVSARLVLDNRQGVLRIGLSGTALLHVAAPDARRAALVVPESAVSQVSGRPAVFVLIGEGLFEMREVVLGASAAGSVEVTSGIRDGEAVVVDGAFTLKSVVLRGTLEQEE